MTPAECTKALLDLVFADRERRRGVILAEARERSAAMLATAHAQARQRMRDAFDEERRRFEAGVGAAKAGLNTHRRLREQRRAAELLAAGLAKLPGELRGRWQRPDARSTWIDVALAEARAVLPRAVWKIVYAPGWPAPDRDRISASLEAACGTPPQWAVDEAISAGLRIGAGGNVVDATDAGLLVDRVDVGSRLLKHLEVDA